MSLGYNFKSQDGRMDLNVNDFNKKVVLGSYLGNSRSVFLQDSPRVPKPSKVLTIYFCSEKPGVSGNQEIQL